MSDVRDMLEPDEDFVSFQKGDVVEYIGDSYHSLSSGCRGIVADVFPVKHGIAYAVNFSGGVLESYVCFDGEIRKVVVVKEERTVH